MFCCCGSNSLFDLINCCPCNLFVTVLYFVFYPFCVPFMLLFIHIHSLHTLSLAHTHSVVVFLGWRRRGVHGKLV